MVSAIKMMLRTSLRLIDRFKGSAQRKQEKENEEYEGGSEEGSEV